MQFALTNFRFGEIPMILNRNINWHEKSFAFEIGEQMIKDSIESVIDNVCSIENKQLFDGLSQDCEFYNYHFESWHAVECKAYSHNYNQEFDKAVFLTLYPELESAWNSGVKQFEYHFNIDECEGCRQTRLGISEYCSTHDCDSNIVV
jgi:hypothetical protein